MKALIIVDVQNDFLPGGNLPVSEGDTIIEAINKAQQNYDLIVATQDWHPPNHKSFASQHPGKNIFEVISLNGSQQVLWPDHCIQMTRGAAFPDALDTSRIDVIFRKGMNAEIDSYSGFFDNKRLKATGLVDYLKGLHVDAVDVCGLAADFCVYFTALDALDLGFKSNILDKATMPINQQDYYQYKEAFREKGGRFI